jgi:hypothetical protein
MRQPPKVGQTLYSLNVNDAARGGKPQILTPVTVVSVGRKYFEVDGPGIFRGQKHKLEDWVQVVTYGSPDCELYWSEQAYKDKLEADAIARQIGDLFEYGRNGAKISLNNLRLIKRIIESSNPSMKMLDETGPEVMAYLKSLKPGEEVIETGSSCMTGKTGVVYESTSDGGTCVKWDLKDGTYMGTSVTWGTRRISDIKS